MNIHVIIPHFRCAKWLNACLYVMRRRASGYIPIAYSVIHMSDEAIAQTDDVRLHPFPQPGKVGGQAIPSALLYGVSLMPDASVTITVDPDALVLCEDWDLLVASKLHPVDVVCAGINPRSNFPDFAETPEWNWMAFKTEYFQTQIGTFDVRRLDIGHSFKDATQRTGHRCHTWPWRSSPFAGRIAAEVGDDECPAFAFHAFYSSRRLLDYIPEGERPGMLTELEEQEAIDDCTRFDVAEKA